MSANEPLYSGPKPCASCQKASVMECHHCGTPYCCGACRDADVGHDAMCCAIHDAGFIGASLPAGQQRIIVKRQGGEIFPVTADTMNDPDKGVPDEFKDTRIGKYVREMRNKHGSVLFYGTYSGELGHGMTRISALMTPAISFVTDVKGAGWLPAVALVSGYNAAFGKAIEYLIKNNHGDKIIGAMFKKATQMETREAPSTSYTMGKKPK
jgi:hypothetical protein